MVIKLNFCSDFEQNVWSRFWSWSSGKIWSWSLVGILQLMFCRGNDVESWSKPGLVNILNFKFSQDIRSRFQSWCLVNILKMKFSFWTCDMTKISFFGKLNSTLGSVVPFFCSEICPTIFESTIVSIKYLF